MIMWVNSQIYMLHIGIYNKKCDINVTKTFQNILKRKILGRTVAFPAGRPGRVRPTLFSNNNF